MKDFPAVAPRLCYIFACKLESRCCGNQHICGEGTRPAIGRGRGLPKEVAYESAVRSQTERVLRTSPWESWLTTTSGTAVSRVIPGISTRGPAAQVLGRRRRRPRDSAASRSGRKRSDQSPRRARVGSSEVDRAALEGMRGLGMGSRRGLAARPALRLADECGVRGDHADRR